MSYRTRRKLPKEKRHLQKKLIQYSHFSVINSFLRMVSNYICTCKKNSRSEMKNVKFEYENWHQTKKKLIFWYPMDL